MGFFDRWKRRPVRNYAQGKLWDNINAPAGNGPPTPTTPINSTQAVDNNYTPGPRLESYLGSGYMPSPYRLHSQADTLQPVIPVQNPPAPGASARTRIRELEWDAGNAGTLRIPDGASQQYYNQRIPLPEFTTPSMPAHAVQCNIYPGQHGWGQGLVPEPGMRTNDVGIAPPVLLSRPIHVKTLTGSVDGTRRAIKKVKAPSRQRSGG